MPSQSDDVDVVPHIALLTRDLRITDNPVIAEAVALGGPTVVLFVLDPALLAAASPNRRWALLGALEDLRVSLRDLGGDLVVREGSTAGVTAALAADVGAGTVHVADDRSAASRRRLSTLCSSLPDEICLELHDAHAIVPAGVASPAAGDHYKVFTPYFRAWDQVARRAIAPTPTRLAQVPGLDPGAIPEVAAFARGAVSPRIEPVGESVALERFERWLTIHGGDYDDTRDDLAADVTSRLSGPLHFGTISATWVESRLDLNRPGHRALQRQLCWRDFNGQLLAAFPALGRQDWRPRGDRWRDDEYEVEAWKQGRTGYPLVDAGMRQLAQEGWMHNRARMVTASFLVKTLHVDWRVGAEHFASLLVDADVANNNASWQWVAGTGADTRPNRVINPVRQAERYDRDAAYIRRWVPELREVADNRDAREPWRLAGTLRAPDYPEPLVDLSEARARFLEDRGVDG